MRPPVLYVSVLTVLTLLTLTAAATTIIVDVDGGGGYTSILPAVMDASEGDTVLIMPGLYEGAFNANIDLGDKNLVIRGASVPESTEIFPYPHGRIFTVMGGQDSTCVIENLRLHRGTSGMGGGILVRDSSPKIVNCLFYRCSSTDGGGAVWNDGGSPTFVDCGFNRNWTNRYDPGGAVWCTGGHATFRDGWFIQNGRVRGDPDGLPYSDGAAVMVEGSSTAVFRHVLFDDNGGDTGGAVSSTAGSAVFEDCTFVDNVGKYHGGVLSAEAGGTYEFTDCLFAKNYSTGQGGVAGCSAGTVMFDGCTLVDNKSTSAGSAVALTDGAHLEAARTIIAFSIYSAPLACFGSSTTDITHSCVFGNAITDSLCGTYHDNLFLDPQFCDRPAGDYTLYSHSLCLPENNPWGEQIGTFGKGCLYPGPLEPPTDLAAWTDGNTVFLSWSQPRDLYIDHYRIERDTTAAFGEHTATMTTPDTDYVDAPLPNWVEQFYRIFTIDNLGGASAPSETLSIIVQPIPPSTPTDFSLTAGDAVVNLAWTASPEDDVDSYAVYRDTTPGAPPVDPYTVVTHTYLHDDGAENYWSYYYKVTAVDTGGLESDPTDELRAVPHGTPPAVTGLRAIPGDSAAFLDWDPVVPRYQDYYKIYRDTLPTMLSQEVVNDGFEAYEPGEPPGGPWGVIEQAGTSVRVTDSVAGEGAKSLALADSSFSYLRAFHAIGDTINEMARIRFLVRPGPVMPEVNLLQCEVSGEGGIGYQAGLLEIRDGVLAHWVNGSGTVTIAPIEPGEWHEIEWRLDCVSDTYGVWLDGGHVVQGAPFYNESRYITALQFRTRNPEWSRNWLDDVLWWGHVGVLATTPENAYVDEPLESGRTYYYRVSVVDTFGAHGPLSEVVEVTTGWVGVDEETAAPEGSLSMNAPNPFRSTTALSYTVPAPGARVNVRIYDVGGRLVRTLVDGDVEAGAYHLIWSGRDQGGRPVASGVYFCRVSIGELRETRKMVLVR